MENDEKQLTRLSPSWPSWTPRALAASPKLQAN